MTRRHGDTGDAANAAYAASAGDVSNAAGAANAGGAANARDLANAGDTANAADVANAADAAGSSRCLTVLPVSLTDRQGRPFVVRLYVPADRPALEAMYTAFEPKRVAQGLPPGKPEAIVRWLDRILADGQHLLVEIEGTLLGHAMLLPMDAERAELANFLHQSIRNRGIGTALNRLILSLARDGHYRRVWLSVEPGNRPAIRSYERAGFRMRPGQMWAPEVEMEATLE